MRRWAYPLRQIGVSVSKVRRWSSSPARVRAQITWRDCSGGRLISRTACSRPHPRKISQLVEKGVKARSIVSARKNLSVKKEVKVDQAHPLKRFSTVCSIVRVFTSLRLRIE